jgi:branched-subunit amino acid transport protein AzlD
MLDWEVLTFFAVMALATFLTRVAPFVAMHRFSDHPLVIHLGAYLPPMLMAVLVIYGVMTLGERAPVGHVLTLVAMLVTASVQWWGRQPLLSILCGTGLYVIGVQWLGI